MGARTYHNKDFIEEALAAVQRLGINARVERWEPKADGGHANGWIMLKLGGQNVRQPCSCMPNY
jgi:hypothetical protein